MSRQNKYPVCTEIKRAATTSEELAPALKDLYERVARELGVDPLYVSRAARGEFQSQAVEDELERQLKSIVESASSSKRFGIHNGNKAGKRTADTV